MTVRISSRHRDLPDMIARREDFETYGALRGGWITEGTATSYPGYLAGPDLEVWQDQRPHIAYVVWSYDTPIAWWSRRYGWHKVSQKFSVTTSKHQGKLFRIGGE